MRKHTTLVVNGAQYLQQMQRAERWMQRLHEIALECGADWDGQDGYAFTSEQHKAYVDRMKAEGVMMSGLPTVAHGETVNLALTFTTE